MLYLSGPMTGKENWNSAAFNEVAGILESEGEKVYSPVSSIGVGVTLGYNAAMLIDFLAIGQADAIVLLPGYESSVGCAAEIAAAIDMGKEIYVWSENRRVKMSHSEMEQHARFRRGTKDVYRAYKNLDRVAKGAFAPVKEFGEALDAVSGE